MERREIVGVRSEVCDILPERVGADPQVVLLTGGEDICQHNRIRHRQRVRKVIHERFCPGIGMRLEDAPDLPVRIVFRCLQRCADFRRVMRVVINDGRTLPLALDLETAVCPTEGKKALPDILHGDAEQVGDGDGCRGVLDIVFTRDFETEMAEVFPVMAYVEGTDPPLIVGNIHRIVVGAFCAVGDHIGTDALCDLRRIRNCAADDKRSALPDIAGKTVEGMADVVQILEKVQVIRVDVQNQSDFRVEAQEAVRVLAGFRDEILRIPDADISANLLQDSPDGNGRIHGGLQLDAGEHGGRGCLAVCSGYGDGIVIVRHNLTEQLCPREHRLAETYSF